MRQECMIPSDVAQQKEFGIPGSYMPMQECQGPGANGSFAVYKAQGGKHVCYTSRPLCKVRR